MTETIIHHGPIFTLVKQDEKYDVIRHRGSVFVVPVLDLVKGMIVAIEYFRPVINRWVWEIPAGIIDIAEPPARTAYRELEEEIGYRANRLIPLGSYYPSYGYSSELCHYFVALDVHKIGEPTDKEENLIVHEITYDQMMEYATKGKMVSGSVMLALMLYRQAHVRGKLDQGEGKVIDARRPVRDDTVQPAVDEQTVP